MTQVVRAFKSARTSIEDNPEYGRASTSMDDDHVQKVLVVIRQNLRLTVREVVEEVGSCKSSWYLIVPRLLTDAQKENRVTVSQEVFDLSSVNENILKNINSWWYLGVRLRCWNKSSVVAVDGKIVATTKNAGQKSL